MRNQLIVDLDVDAACEETFVFFYMGDAAPIAQRTFGIFVRSAQPEPEGTRVRLTLRRGSAPPLFLTGRVVWVNPFRPGDVTSITPGMGIELLAADRHERQRLLRSVRKLAYLDLAWPQATTPADSILPSTIN
ncbi:MAG: PilZ domain-containing protein [Myxococcales bacterium]|nr:PilZ domain-containing protein [Myxococcales bacterium]